MFFKTADIFIVEDEVLISEDLAGALSDLGHNVVGSASNAKDAMAEIPASGAQVALLDIHIEGKMDGIELGKWVKQNCGLPIIYISAYIDPETRNRAAQTQPSGFLTKPFDEKELEVAIKFALGKASKLAKQSKKRDN